MSASQIVDFASQVTLCNKDFSLRRNSGKAPAIPCWANKILFLFAVMAFSKLRQLIKK